MMVTALRKKLNYNPDDTHILPLTTKLKCVEELDSIVKKIENVETESLK